MLLLLSGVLLGFIPALREIQLPPEVVLLLFLPPLLYWESITTSLREIRSNLVGIIAMSTVLVILTAWAVAVTLHWIGLPWGPAWVGGAALAPTDATAVGVLARALPRRDLTVLRAESLINDGTALVVYSLAVGVTVGSDHLTALHVTWNFLLAYAGGVLAGLLVAWLGVEVRRRIADPLLENVAVVLIPFSAFLIAEEIHASGVVAVVVCGLIMSQAGPYVGTPTQRLQTNGFWAIATFLLNGSLFILVGLESQTAVRGLSSIDLRRALLAVGVVSLVLVAVRFAFLFLAPSPLAAFAALERQHQHPDRRPDRLPGARGLRARSRVVNGVAGFRGAVSLAAALGVPTSLDDGDPFPDRDVIVFVVFGVIALTLVVQAFLMPLAVRWADLPADSGEEAERELAIRVATEEVLDALPEIAAGLAVDDEVVDRLRAEYDAKLTLNAIDADTDDEEEERLARQAEQYRRLRRAALAHKRATVLRLRDERQIDDVVLRRIQARLDIEDVRLSRGDLVE